MATCWSPYFLRVAYILMHENVLRRFRRLIIFSPIIEMQFPRCGYQIKLYRHGDCVYCLELVGTDRRYKGIQRKRLKIYPSLDEFETF